MEAVTPGYTHPPPRPCPRPRPSHRPPRPPPRSDTNRVAVQKGFNFNKLMFLKGL